MLLYAVQTLYSQCVCGVCVAIWGVRWRTYTSSVKHIKCVLNWKQEMIITYLVHLAKHTINNSSTANYYALPLPL